jgi:hypothetical protein
MAGFGKRESSQEAALTQQLSAATAQVTELQKLGDPVGRRTARHMGT